MVGIAFGLVLAAGFVFRIVRIKSDDMQDPKVRFIVKKIQASVRLFHIYTPIIKIVFVYGQTFFLMASVYQLKLPRSSENLWNSLLPRIELNTFIKQVCPRVLECSAYRIHRCSASSP